jgi:hypothetical protein
MGGAAELGALTEIVARRAGHELQRVVVSWDDINFSAQLRYPEGVDDVVAGDMEDDVGSDGE